MCLNTSFVSGENPSDMYNGKRMSKYAESGYFHNNLLHFELIVELNIMRLSKHVNAARPVLSEETDSN